MAWLATPPGQLPIPSLQISVPATGACGSPVKMMSWKTVPVSSRSKPSAAGVRTAESGSKRRVGIASMYAQYAVPVALERRLPARRLPLCIDCRHAADDCRGRRIPGTAGLPGALRGPLRRAGPGTGAVRRRSRPARRHRRRPGLLRGPAPPAPPLSRRPRHHLPGRGACTARTWCSPRSGPAGQPAAPPTSGWPWTWGSSARKPPGPAASPTRCGPSRTCWSSLPRCGATALTRGC